MAGRRRGRAFRRRRAAGFGTTGSGFFATGSTFGSPTSAPSGGGSGARRSPGTSRSAIRPTTTIAATRATRRHLIRTPAIPCQGLGDLSLSPVA
jgi:hypothetical protein